MGRVGGPGEAPRGRGGLRGGSGEGTARRTRDTAAPPAGPSAFGAGGEEPQSAAGAPTLRKKVSRQLDADEQAPAAGPGASAGAGGQEPQSAAGTPAAPPASAAAGQPAGRKTVSWRLGADEQAGLAGRGPSGGAEGLREGIAPAALCEQVLRLLDGKGECSTSEGWLLVGGSGAPRDKAGGEGGLHEEGAASTRCNETAEDEQAAHAGASADGSSSQARDPERSAVGEAGPPSRALSAGAVHAGAAPDDSPSPEDNPEREALRERLLQRLEEEADAARAGATAARDAEDAAQEAAAALAAQRQELRAALAEAAAAHAAALAPQLAALREARPSSQQTDIIVMTAHAYRDASAAVGSAAGDAPSASIFRLASAWSRPALKLALLRKARPPP